MNKKNNSINESCCGEWNGKHHDPIGPLLLILAGFILLLNNFGVLSFRIWDVIFRFWPVLLILAGIRVLLGRTTLGNFLADIIGFVAIACVLLISAATVDPTVYFWVKYNLPFLLQIPVPSY